MANNTTTPLAANTIAYTVIPTGGLVRLNITSVDAGYWTLTRNVVNGTPYVLYYGLPPVKPDHTGNYNWVFLDLGDGSNEPLDQTQTYSYTFSTTTAGSVNTGDFGVACTLTLEMDPYLPIVFRAYKAAISALVLPTAFKNQPTVQIAMPLTGAPTLPIVSIAPSLIQQMQVPLGHGIDTDSYRNFYTIQEQVMRRYVISVHASTPDERDFLTTACILIFKGILTEILGQLGQNVSHRFQAASSQVVDIQPGFYFSEISLEFQGNFVAGITTNFGPIVAVAANVNGEATFSEPI